MPTQLQFTGTEERWFETAFTGRSRSWSAGRIAEVSDAEAAQLLSTGKFRRMWATTVAEQGTPPSLSPVQMAAVLRASPQRHTYYLGLFGDSITHNGYYNSAVSVSAGASWFNPSAADNIARSWGWSTWVGPLSMQRAQVVKSWARQTNGLLSAGSSPAGYPLSVQVTEALADPLWDTVNRAVIVIGTNDVSSTIAACTAELLTQIARIGKPVDLVASPPLSTGHTAASGDSPLPVWAWLQQWRATLKRIADASGGWVRFIDGYTPLIDTTTSPAVYASGHTYDNTHPNNVAAYKIAVAYVDSLFPSGIGGDLDIWPHNSSAATSNCALLDQGFANPVLATASGGTGTGTIAGSLTVTNIATATHSGSVAANTMTGGTGNMQTIAVTSNANGDGVDVAGATFHAAGAKFMSAGDVAWAQCLLRINSGGIYPRNLFWRLQGYDGTTNWNALLWELNTTNEAALPLTAARTFLLRTPLLTKQAGADFSNLQLKLRATFAGAGSCTIDIGNIECRRFRSGGVYA